MGLYPLSLSVVRYPQQPRATVEFILRYRGDVSARSRNNTKAKQAMRRYFEPQLEELCRRDPLFRDALKPGLPVCRFIKGRADIGHVGGYFFRHPLSGHDFVPLLNSPNGFVCELDITWLRHEARGDVLNAGDLDNRLKNLLDGLRMPKAATDLHGVAKASGDSRCLCLLEDDALVHKFSVTTHELLEAKTEETKSQVELIIKVTVRLASSHLPGSYYPL